MLFGDGFSGDESEVFKSCLAGVESPEIDHEHARTGNHGLLADGSTDLDSLAEDVGELFEPTPPRVPHVKSPDGFDELFSDPFIASPVDASKTLIGAGAVLAGAESSET